MSLSVNDNCEQKSHAFMTWMHQSNGASINPKIKIAYNSIHRTGRGIVASENIEKDEELFSLSLSNVLTVANSDLPSQIPTEFEALDQWTSLVLVMIYETGRKENSRWWAYLNVLPKNFDTLMYWSPSELAELQGSAVLSKICKDEASSAFIERLLPVVRRHPGLFGDYASTFSGQNAESGLLDIAHRMATLIMAYAFCIGADDLEGDGSEDESSTFDGMVPLADLFNANGDKKNARILQDKDNMTMVACKSIRRGEEILNDYGQLPRSDLPRRYGYITDEYKKWDVVELDVETVLQVASAYIGLEDKQKEARLRIVSSWEDYEEGYDLRWQPLGKTFQFNPALLLVIAAFTSDPETFKESYAADKTPEPPPSITKDIALVLRDIILQRRNRYGTSIAEDVILLQNVVVQGRRRMAIEVRLSEKEILATALDTLMKKITSLQLKPSTFEASNGQESGSQSKKRRT